MLVDGKIYIQRERDRQTDRDRQGGTETDRQLIFNAH